MKTHNLTFSPIAALTSLTAAFAISSCTLPPSEAWHQIKRDGLITFLATPYPPSTQITPVTPNTVPTGVTITPARTMIATNNQQFVGPPKQAATVATTPAPTISSNSSIAPAPVKNPVNIMPAQDKALQATTVPSLPGYVRSPYTVPPRLVDVKGIAPGASMVCPYSQRVFIIPSDFVSHPEGSLVSTMTTTAPKVRPQPPVIAVKNNPPVTNPTTNVVKSTPPVANPTTNVVKSTPPVTNPTTNVVKSAPPSTTPPVTNSIAATNKNSTPNIAPEPTTPPANALFKTKPVNNTPPASAVTASVKPAEPELPYGMPIPNRPGFVNSPFAAKHQLVDVTGLPIGMEVKCPYTGKLFKVPASDIAEQKTLASPGAPTAIDKAEKK